MSTATHHSSPEAGDEPQEQAKSDAQQDAGRQGKVKRGVLAFVHNIAGQAAQPEREFAAKIKEGANQREQCRHN
jgi:hypothetical protein